MLFNDSYRSTSNNVLDLGRSQLAKLGRQSRNRSASRSLSIPSQASPMLEAFARYDRARRELQRLAVDKLSRLRLLSKYSLNFGCSTYFRATKDPALMSVKPVLDNFLTSSIFVVKGIYNFHVVVDGVILGMCQAGRWISSFCQSP